MVIFKGATRKRLKTSGAKVFTQNEATQIGSNDLPRVHANRSKSEDLATDQYTIVENKLLYTQFRHSNR